MRENDRVRMIIGFIPEAEAAPGVAADLVENEGVDLVGAGCTPPRRLARRAALHEAADRYGRFLDRAPSIRITPNDR